MSQAAILCHRRALAIERQNRSGGKSGQTSRPSITVKKLHFHTIGWQDFHDRAHVADLDVRPCRRL